MTEIPYCTREDIAGALDFKQTARAARAIDRAVASGSRSVDSLCHRTFYPELDTRLWDWPNGQHARPWRLWLDQNELISVTALTTGNTVIPATNYFLEPNQDGPPYNRLEIDLDSPSAFGGGGTHQRDISITGLYGYRDAHTTVGTTTTALDAVQTTLTVTGEASAQLGVGSLLRLDGERMLVTGRRQTDTGQTLAAGMDAQAKSVTVTVASGAGYATDEVVLIGGERMLIVDIAGNSLIVKRAWDGSVAAAHSAGAAVYAPRTLTVTRAACGSIASTHSDSAVVERWDPPALVHQLATAEAINTVLQEQAGWFRTASGGSSSREATLDALKSLRSQTYDAHGRKARLRGV
ncbi:hypothetical protein OG292_19320 [Streptomyces sp. NBC_01511]|uniref:hypothetical protein n=1 Tax=Streptomyces sp. NBC_01511 TaxID=2903889 RepID=UPI00386A1E50